MVGSIKNLSMDMAAILFGFNKDSNKIASLNFSSTSSVSLFNFGDGISFSRGDTVLRLAVQKMQSAINRPITLANGMTFNGAFSANQSSFTLFGQSGSASSAPAFTPTTEQIDQAVAAAGGREALNPWLVDGKTKIQVDGRTVVASVDSSSSSSGGDAKAAAAASIARFGFSADRLDGNLGQLRDELRNAAAAAQGEQGDLSLSIEYALEDAFAKLRTLEGGDPATAYEEQLKTNKAQADSIMSQLNLGAGSGWAMESAAADLAVFGKDMTALSNPATLASEIQKLADEKFAELKRTYVGTESEYQAESHRISGALSRLQSGLKGGSFASAAALGVSGSATVTVGGVSINAASVVSVVNVIADPLVFDLNGDGIDLSSAEEGVDFDMDGDGTASRTGFIRGDDAFLFLDKDGDGVASDGTELFGNADGYANGFEKLKAYDENGDGVIDENDAVYDQLRLWVEKNEDGVCDESEALTLAEAGIKSIRVDYDNVREDDGKGNLIGQKGSFTRTDGSEGMAADVWLREIQK